MKITHINEWQLAIKEKMDAFVEKLRPAPELRDELDIGYIIDGRSVIIFEIRPDYTDPQERIEIPVAKATFVGKSSVWKLYRMRSNGKWSVYGPVPTVDSIGSYTKIVHEDAYGCFWG